jgi:hypothetical protein
VPIKRARPAEFRATLAGRRESCVDTLHDHASLKFGYRRKDVHL